MVVTGVWLGLLVAGLALHVLCRRSGGRLAGIGPLLSAAWGRVLGRLALVALWAFVGWHVFARYRVVH